MTKEDWKEVLELDRLALGELLVVRCKDNFTFDAIQDHLEQISSLLDEAGVTAIVMPQGFKLESLPEVEMNRYGWTRKDA
jgi:2-C-methyl-D-erythritol 4-phosphate cytidylyltransferase